MQQHHRPLIILDFGSQYTQLIGRRIREMGVYCEIHPYSLSESQLKALAPCGVILSGGPATATLTTYPKMPQWLFTANLPVLGICYGMQIMAAQLGGKVQSTSVCEFGYAELCLQGHSALLENIADRITRTGEEVLDVWMSHGDQVTALPPDFIVICKTHNAPIAGIANEQRHWYGLQFHPEVTHTPQGMRILQRFVIDICQADTNWTSEHIIEQIVTTMRAQVGDTQVLLGLSGGVDSAVAAALLHKAIGAQLLCVFVDTGLLRLHEKEQLLSMFKEHLSFNLITIEASARFVTALAGVGCPEEKRKIIGHLFVQVFEEVASTRPNVHWLAQGTIYPDVIESAGVQQNASSGMIKSHHNVGGLPAKLKLQLLEPLRELFKDEVRNIGVELGLPVDMVYRHPFPGPGLAVRILGVIKPEFITILRYADAIFIEELKKANLYSKVSQAFAVFLPIKTVGVMGDNRRYDYVIGLRAVETIDFMTAHWAKLSWDFLATVSNRIINEVAGVSRVVYDISGKPPATIEWE